MKKLSFLFSTVALSTLLFTSCQKETIAPSQEKQENTQSIQNKAVSVPQILGNTYSCKKNKSGTSLFYIGFNQVTANYWGSNVYLHWKYSSSSTWNTGVLPLSWSNPNAVYTSNISILTGTSVDVYFSDVPGAGGITSPTYTMIAQ